MKNTVLLICILLLYSNDAICCSCFGKGKISVMDYNSYHLIFRGTLISEVRSDKRYCKRTAVYKVSNAYKGVSNGDTVLVCDAEHTAACGLGRLTIGRDFLVYTSGRDTNWTSDCTRTTLVPIQFWPQDSIEINRLKNMRSFGRIFEPELTNFHSDTAFLNKHILRTRKDSVQKFYNDAGKLIAIGRYKKGIPDGFWDYLEEGKGKGKYINGLKDSMWIEPFMENSVYHKWYKLGEYTYQETRFYDGKIAGKKGPVENGSKWIENDYHSNGQPRFTATVNPPRRDKNGKLIEGKWDGPFKTFNKSGIVLEAGNHDNGYRIGRWKFYYENGKIRMEGQYIKGEKSGIWKIYYPNKSIKAVGTYKNDEKLDDWKFYDEDGIDMLPNFKLIEEDEDFFTYSGVKK